MEFDDENKNERGPNTEFVSEREKKKPSEYRRKWFFFYYVF